MTFEACALVLLGGFIGGIARIVLSGLIGRSVGETFPWGTLAVNVSGALAVGAFAGAARSVGGIFATEALREFVVVGVLGGYTTVSSFALQTMNLALGGERRDAALYVVVSALLCVAAVAVGYWSIVRMVG
jgi:CrcB protein